MCRARCVLIIVALSYGTTQAWLGWVSAAAAFFLANKGMDSKHDHIDLHAAGSIAIKADQINPGGPAYVGCIVHNKSPDENGFLGLVNAKTHLNDLYTGCSIKVQDGFNWVYDNKLTCCGAAVAAVYGYTLVRIIALQRFLRSPQCWGAWHEEADLSNLSQKESSVLREELLVEVRRQYPKSDDLVPVHSFMHDLEKEIAVYNNYITLIERITRVDGYEHLVTDRFRDAYIGLLGNTPQAQKQGEWLFDWLSIKRWLRVDEQALERCIKRREHVMHLKAFYAEWLTTVRAIYKQKK